MALPAGVASVNLTFGSYVDATGAVKGAGLVGTIVPASKIVAGNGSVVTVSPVTVTLDNTGSGSIVLPTGGTYTITWSAGRFDWSPGNMTFTLPGGSPSTVDFDLLTPVASTPTANVTDALIAGLLADPTSLTRTAAINLPTYPGGA